MRVSKEGKMTCACVVEVGVSVVVCERALRPAAGQSSTFSRRPITPIETGPAIPLSPRANNSHPHILHLPYS
jgi:hypothetical protein